MEDKGIYTSEIMEFVKQDEARFCDCIVDIEGIYFFEKYFAISET